MDARAQYIERKIRIWVLQQERKRLGLRRTTNVTVSRPPAKKPVGRDPS
ncbi:MAG TPA: hypothetical protein VMD09_15425 [Solirubrobacteraceae bacterium]|nr:hypothetical protein [Solirubrobacteraceae bacterium]